MVRAKFYCSEKKISKLGNEFLETYIFNPVTSGSVENKGFFKFTPTGRLELGTVNKDVHFEIGEEYYLDFTAASFIEKEYSPNKE